MFLMRWLVSGRNGYYGVDNYRYQRHNNEPNSSWGQFETVECVKTRKLANSIASACTSAYRAGIMDAHVGLTLPLIRSVLPFWVGDIVAIVERQGPNFLIRRGTLEAYASLEDFRELPVLPPCH